jgi:Predicted permease
MTPIFSSWTGRGLAGHRRQVVDRRCTCGLGPNASWQSLFLVDQQLLAKLWGPIVGPFVAIISFVCSVSNIPLASVLWNGGISLGSVIAFIFAGPIGYLPPVSTDLTRHLSIDQKRWFRSRTFSLPALEATGSPDPRDRKAAWSTWSSPSRAPEHPHPPRWVTYRWATCGGKVDESYECCSGHITNTSHISDT